MLPTPTIGPDEVLIYVMASGINYNNVWAALGQPLDVIAERLKMGEPEDFHAGGSDCSGIVWATGKDVKSFGESGKRASGELVSGGGPPPKTITPKATPLAGNRRNSSPFRVRTPTKSAITTPLCETRLA